MSQNHFVIVYDSDEDSARRKVRSAIRAFGGWKQYSVFECLLSETEQAELFARLDQVVAQAEGDTRIRCYKLSAAEGSIHTIPEEAETDDGANNII
ncbi:CRISPR-associated endonuclease Cas2 [Salinigranum rubrum]|uniref:CRISPR-associated endoribonuclease Cas2 n=1 Tax=Salinigranum rubrum TaxID=755307 RepID=A0A2I8VLU4_9EURY|nr:CRISPR-associated endonuclease Cas2 [Salinigranum rubrum]